MRQRREVAQLEGVVAGDAVVLADRGEDLGLLDGVDAEVGLQIEVHVQQLRRVAGELGDDPQHGFGELVARRRQRRRRRLRHRRSRGRLGGRCGRWSAGLVANPADDMRQRREVAQLEGVVAGDAVVAADRGEDLGLFDGVDAEVGLQVEVDVEQVGRVAGELGDDADHGVGDLVAGSRGRGRRRGDWLRRGRLDRCRGCRGRLGGGGTGLVADPADDVRQRREVAQLEGVVAGDAVVAADRGEDLGLFDGVDAEVGFQVEVDVEQVGRIAGELRDDADHGVGQLVAVRRRSHRSRRGCGCCRRWRSGRRGDRRGPRARPAPSRSPPAPSAPQGPAEPTARPPPADRCRRSAAGAARPPAAGRRSLRPAPTTAATRPRRRSGTA